AYGIKLMSLGLLMPKEQALIWRGSLVDEGLPGLFTDVAWGELDVLLVDLPPGTSDVHLGTARQVQLAGVVTVSAPGQTSVEDVRRGMEMFADIAVPCLGLVENMAGVRCRQCGDVQRVFGDGGVESLAEATGVPLLARIPFEPEVASRGDNGEPMVVAAPDSQTAREICKAGAALCERLRLTPADAEAVA
ncbi:MAG: Mrp/NBP35 family ATP-binding protein, partial [Gammaproteobacteria bacterium]|nr:Mrp/NBP35 family ATP-binding protein [Gammaproteobacteria bacterium]